MTKQLTALAAMRRVDEGKLAAFQGDTTCRIALGELEGGKAQSISMLDQRYNREK